MHHSPIMTKFAINHKKEEKKMNILKGAVAASVVIAAIMTGCNGNTAKSEKSQPAENKETSMEGMKTIEADGMKLTWIQDNTQERLMERTLFADASDELIDSLGLAGGIPATISVFMLEKDGKTILFDTGNGNEDSRLTDGLAAMNLTAADIDYICLTHFHGDHIGGMMHGDSAAFPKAEVYASQTEYDAWLKDMPEDRNAMQRTMAEAYSGRINLFNAGDTLPCGIITVDAAGHTPGHTAFIAGKVLVAGDLMHGAALQLPHPEICAAYDMDKKNAVEARKRILKYARENKMIMAGMHLPAPAFISFAQ